MASVPSSAILGSSTLKKADFWDVSSPVQLNPTSKGGHHYFPSHLTPASRRRRIVLEVHSANSVFESIVAESVYVRILYCNSNPIETILDTTANVTTGTVKGAAKTLKGTAGFVSGTIQKIRSKEDDVDSDSDVESVKSSLVEQPSVTDGESANGVQVQTYEGWQPKYKVPLPKFDIVGKKRRSATVKYEYKGRSYHREFVFDTDHALCDFCDAIEMNKNMMADRLKARLEGAMEGIELEKDEKLTLLFDICSGSQLPCSDIGNSSDPYVSVRFNGKIIHKTDKIMCSTNPIWTLRKGSLFIWKVDALELFESEEGVIFEVKDYDMIGKHDSLGVFHVDARTLYQWSGERKEFALKPISGQKARGENGKISIRVRRATYDDIQFMEKYNMKKQQKTIAVPSVTAGGGAIKNILSVKSKKEKEGPDKGKTIYLIRPGPDPKRIEETSWLTTEKIEQEAMKPSYEWADIGSGHLGKVFVEILSCDNLPNMDSVGVFDIKTGVLGNKTDPFVSLVYEDCSARTDIIYDCLSPRWMPWSKRAFIFHCMHTSSPLFLAVFDSDQVPHINNDLIGRVTIDISNFHPGSTYVLEYNLYSDASFGLREAKFGTIKIRLRLEMENERTLLLSNCCVPLNVYVNQATKKDFEVLRQTIEGRVDSQQFSLSTINAHWGELLSHLTLFFLFGEAFMSLVLWRGQSEMTIPMPSYSTPKFFKWIDLQFPLHSLVVFVCLINLVENYDLLPSLFFAAVGWLLLSTSKMRAANPNPWLRRKGFPYLLMSLIMGDNITGPHLVEANEGDAGDILAERLQYAHAKAKKWYEEYNKNNEQYLKDLAEIGDASEDLTAQTAETVYLNPTKVYLVPIQNLLRVICIWLRVFKNIIVWEECYISFWITLSSFFLSIILFFIPWGFLIRWSLRVIVWVAFGPWMRLADMYYFSRVEEENDDQNHKRMKRLLLEKRKWLDTQKQNALIAREKKAKLKDFKQYLFGRHICKVNILKKERYYDIPLPTSSATLYDPKSMSLGEVAMQEAGYHRTRVDGQNLVGEMIPKICAIPASEAPVGKPTKTTLLLERGSSAAFYDGNDSFTEAAVKVGSILACAGAITFYGVPLAVYALGIAWTSSDWIIQIGYKLAVGEDSS